MAFRRTEHCKETSGMPPHLDTGIIPYDLSPFSATSVWKSVQIEKERKPVLPLRRKIMDGFGRPRHKGKPPEETPGLSRMDCASLRDEEGIS
jgi:hypothetical protein